MTATERGERVLATAAAVGLVFGSAMLVTQGAGLPASAARPVLLALVGVELVAELLLAGLFFRLGRVDHRWVAADVGFRAAMLTVAAVVASADGQWVVLTAHANSPLYDFTLTTTFLVGVATWRLRHCLGAAAVVAAVSAGGELWLGNPAWNVLPNSANFFGVALVGWVLAWQLRWVARQIDVHRADAVRQAELLAVERERVRYSDALRERVLATLDELVAADAVADRGLAARVRDETVWLRDFMADDEPRRGLGEALTGLAAEFGRSGLRVSLDVGPLPEPAPVLVEAAREALTNVVKHAGTADVAVRAFRDRTGWHVEVSDRGGGFGAEARPGVGRTESITARLAEAGGTASISSAPGAGTVVRLWLPG